jgi:hypothetical protein
MRILNLYYHQVEFFYFFFKSPSGGIGKGDSLFGVKELSHFFLLHLMGIVDTFLSFQCCLLNVKVNRASAAFLLQ